MAWSVFGSARPTSISERPSDRFTAGDGLRNTFPFRYAVILTPLAESGGAERRCAEMHTESRDTTLAGSTIRYRSSPRYRPGRAISRPSGSGTSRSDLTRSGVRSETR
jgi:hypothetical protein